MFSVDVSRQWWQLLYLSEEVHRDVGVSCDPKGLLFSGEVIEVRWEVRVQHDIVHFLQNRISEEIILKVGTVSLYTTKSDLWNFFSRKVKSFANIQLIPLSKNDYWNLLATHVLCKGITKKKVFIFLALGLLFPMASTYLRVDWQRRQNKKPDTVHPHWVQTLTLWEHIQLKLVEIQASFSIMVTVITGKTDWQESLLHNGLVYITALEQGLV